MAEVFIAGLLGAVGYNISNFIKPTSTNNNNKSNKQKSSLVPSQNIETFQNIYNNIEPEPKEPFHNNMQPFFGSNVTQNTSSDSFSTKLSNFTGNFTDGEYKTKKETENMFKTTQTGGNVFGTPIANLIERYNNPLNKHNDKPFEEIQVGPGLGLSYNENPQGGYQQLDTQEYAKPRSITHLRTKNNQQVSYTEPTVKGTTRNPNNTGIKSPNTKFKKNNLFVNRTQLPNGSYNSKPIYKSGIILSDNNRKTTSVERFNPGGKSSRQRIIKGKYRQSSRNILKNIDITHNVSSVNRGEKNRYAYKKAKINNKEIVSIKGGSDFRNFISTSVNTLKNILFKPRPTMKETTINGYGLLNPTGKLKLKYRNNQPPKRTIKEMTAKNQYYGSSNGKKKINYNTRKHIIPNTHRQTTDRDYTGIANRSEGNGNAYKIVDKTFIPSTTNKQITSDHEYIGQSGTSGTANTQNREYVLNMNQNLSKEVISKGRKPKGSGQKTSISGKDINIHVNRNNLQTEKYNYTLSTKPNNFLGSNNTHITSTKDSLINETECQSTQRLHPDINNQLDTNPYNFDITKTKTI